MGAAGPRAGWLVLRGHEGAVDSVVISPDNRQLVSYRGDGIVRIWDLANPYPAAIATLAGVNGFRAVPE